MATIKGLDGIRLALVATAIIIIIMAALLPMAASAQTTCSSTDRGARVRCAMAANPYYPSRAGTTTRYSNARGGRR